MLGKLDVDVDTDGGTENMFEAEDDADDRDEIALEDVCTEADGNREVDA